MPGDHDPLCVCSRKDHAHWLMDDPEVCMCCSCDDIAQVRADEREQAAQRVAAVHADRRVRSIERVIAAVRREAS